ncbi:MAG: cell division protein SepF [Lachnospiraceae bacterium]|nr:cell division protein SepF [Lachnospiraceae bacterium]
MANFFNKIIETLKLSDDDEAFEEYEERSSYEKPRQKASGDQRGFSRQSKNSAGASQASSDRKAAHIQSNYGTSTYIEGSSNEKTLRMERPEGSKVVPLKTTSSGLEVCVMKPKNLDDSQDICDVLLSNCVAIVNLEGIDIATSQRIMDFISGAVYSINGKLLQIADLIFITAPGSVDISGDYNDILTQTGFDVPILK